MTVYSWIFCNIEPLQFLGYWAGHSLDNNYVNMLSFALHLKWCVLTHMFWSLVVIVDGGWTNWASWAECSGTCGYNIYRPRLVFTCRLNFVIVQTFCLQIVQTTFKLKETQKDRSVESMYNVLVNCNTRPNACSQLFVYLAVYTCMYTVYFLQIQKLLKSWATVWWSELHRGWNGPRVVWIRRL